MIHVLNSGGFGRLVLALLLVSGAASCGDDSSSDEADDAREESGPDDDTASDEPELDSFSVETFSDDSRPTDDPGGEHSAATRTLETDVYVPDGDGPFPLIVHAHGFDGNAGKYTELLTAWAEAGFVVAAPTFPLTNDVGDPPGVFADYQNQPGDVAFVIDELLAASAGDHPELEGRIDEERIGVSGHSLGGVTVYGLVFNDCCRDERVDAAVALSAASLDFDDGSYAFEGTPLLVMLSTDDATVRYDDAVMGYDEAASPKTLVELEGDGHFEPYEDVESPHDEVVRATTTAFWEANLLDDSDAMDRLIEAAESDELTSVTDEP